ncbi:MAG: hypothetical protein LBL75_03510 [Rickettsiales bacterium]|jgi:hypothetical protein|nr:hypothetical protein [Rickettsiales bacterium]
MDDKQLKFSKQVIDKYASGFSVHTAENYAIGFRNHIMKLYNLPEIQKQVIKWALLSKPERQEHIKELILWSLRYKINDVYNIKINFAENTEHPDTLGSASKETGITIYDKLLESDNYEKVIDVISHETTHIFQFYDAKTTIYPEYVSACAQYYIPPKIDINYYLKNPIEREAFTIGNKVSRNFINDMLAQYYNTNYNQHTA